MHKNPYLGTLIAKITCKLRDHRELPLGELSDSASVVQQIRRGDQPPAESGWDLWGRLNSLILKF